MPQLPQQVAFLKVLNYLVCAEPNDGGVSQDGDEHLGLKEQVSARHFKGSGEPSQTSGQGVEHLIKNHLTCAVILDIADRIETQASDKQPLKHCHTPVIGPVRERGVLSAATDTNSFVILQCEF